MMLHTALLIGNDRVQINIFHTFKNIPLHIWIHPLQRFNELLDLHTFGAVFFIIACVTIVVGVAISFLSGYIYKGSLKNDDMLLKMQILVVILTFSTAISFLFIFLSFSCISLNI